MKTARWIVAGLLFVVAGCQTTSQETADPKDRVVVNMGTGGQGGVYLPTGYNICQMVRKERTHHGITCYARESRGSVANLKAMRTGDIQVAIAQSDWHSHAYKGTARFSSAGPDKDLRSLFSLYSEPVTLIVHPDSGIKTIHDLKGKVVNIERPGTGTEAYWNLLWSTLGYTNADVKRVTQMRTKDAAGALCNKDIDAFLWVVGNPNSITERAVETCRAAVVEVADPAFDRLVASDSYLRQGVVPGGVYRTTPNDVKTIGVGPTLVTTREMPGEVVYDFVKAVFENFEAFKDSHIAFSTLKKEEMVKAGLTAPLHPGALKYYREAGLM